MKFTLETVSGKPEAATPNPKMNFAAGAFANPSAPPEVNYDPERTAGIVPVFKSGFIDDQQKQIQMFAAERFPDDPDAVNRYGATPDGNIYYIADDGKAYAEVPDDWSIPSAAKIAAGGIGKTIPFATGAAAGILSSPMLLAGPAGIATSVGLTSGAAAAGEGARQAIGNAFFEDPVNSGEVYKEAAFAGGGQALAAGMAKFAGRHAARDLSRLDTSAASDLGQKANAFGVRLSPAEQTNLRTLGAKEKVLKELPDSANVMDEFKFAQQDDVSRATNAFLDDVSRVDDALPAGQMVRDAAQSSVDRLAAKRAEQARPIYERAFAKAPSIDIQPVIDSIDETVTTLKRKGPIASKLKQIRNLLVDKIDDTEFPEDSLEVLHTRKLEIDDLIEKTPGSSIGNTTRRELVKVQNQLLDAIDAASPDYAMARSIYKDLSPGVDAAKDGIVGALANLNDKNLENAAKMMFSGSRGPQAVRNAKELISKENPAAWNGLLRSFLQKELAQAGKEFSTTRGITNQGSKFAMRVMGTPEQQKIMRAAMTDSQYKTFTSLIDVLKATGRTAATNSDTAFKQQAISEMKRDGGNAFTKGARVMSGPLTAIREYAEDVALGRHAEDLARRFTEPGAVNSLKELTKLPPNSLRARVLVGQFLGLGASSVDFAPDVSAPPPNPLAARSIVPQ